MRGGNDRPLLARPGAVAASRLVDARVRRRDETLAGRRLDIIAQNEERQRSGAGFRTVMWAVMLVMVLLLLALKFDAEVRLHLDDRTQIVKTTAEEAARQEEELTKAGVRFEESGNVVPGSVEEAMARASQSGDTSTAVMLKDLGTQLSTTLRYDPFKTLGVSRRASPSQVEAAFEEKIKTPGLSSREIAQIKQSRDMLTSVPARTFVALTGLAPPESMKHMSARDEGFGVKLQLRQRYNIMLYHILAHFEHHALAQLGAVLFILAPAIIMLTKRLPAILGAARNLQGIVTSSDDDAPGSSSAKKRR